MAAISDAERWRDIEAIFYAALEVDPAIRPEFLQARCNGDTGLREEVASLLEAATKTDEFLITPVCDAVKSIVAQSHSSRLEPGARLNQYEVLSKIGAGGMGEVYLAADTRLRRQVALKILAADLSYDAHAFERFEQEAQAASALNHPNILTIFEFGQADGLGYIVSEYVEGLTLRERLLGRKLEVNAAIGIATQIVSALAAAHAAGIVHRDVKPENILVRSDGLAKLLDFGIAKLGALRTDLLLSQNTILRSPGQTQPGMVMGTARYMSPEQAQGLVLDGRSDLFSVGTVIYEMLAGVSPFTGESKDEVICEIVGLDPPPLVEFTPEAPPELEHIVEKALRKDREMRYQTARDLLVDLQQLQKRLDFEANLQRAGYADGGHRRSRPITGSRQAAPPPSPSPVMALPEPQGAAANIEERGWKKGPVLVLAFIVLLAAVAALWLHPMRKSDASLSEASMPRSLAVLPFRNLNQDPGTDFLAFSLADSVITKLGYVKALTVRPSSSVEAYRGTSMDPQKIAAQLHVDMLLTGAYIREGNALRITTQLVDVKPNTILWRDTMDVPYDRLLTVEDRVAQQIIDGLSLKLSPAETERLHAGRPANKTAYEYYLRGVDLYALNDFDQAIGMLQKATALEPEYALAWAQLGRAYTTHASLQFGGREYYAKAQAAYQKALALDPSLVEARVYMANLLTDTGRVEEAVPLLKEALETNPSNAEAHWELGYAYRFAGMLEDSVAEAEEARRLDPEVKINSSAINSYLYLGEYRKFLDSLPANTSVYMLFYRGLGEYYLGHLAEARVYFDRAYGMDPALMPAPIGGALSHGMRHREREGLQIMRETEARVNQQGVSDPEMLYKIAQAYAVLGDTPSALRALQQSIEGGFFCFPYFASDPLLNRLRENDVFKHLLLQAQNRHDQFRQRFTSRRSFGGA